MRPGREKREAEGVLRRVPAVQLSRLVEQCFTSLMTSTVFKFRLVRHVDVRLELMDEVK